MELKIKNALGSPVKVVVISETVTTIASGAETEVAFDPAKDKLEIRS